MTNLAALLADPARVADVPAVELPALLAQVAAEQSRLAALSVAVAARMATNGTGAAHGAAEARPLVEDVEEVARIVRHSSSWVRKNGHRLPGFSQPGGKRTRVAWERAALVAWANGGGS